jgi:hypothetical protein
MALFKLYLYDVTEAAVFIVSRGENVCCQRATPKVLPQVKLDLKPLGEVKPKISRPR